MSWLTKFLDQSQRVADLHAEVGALLKKNGEQATRLSELEAWNKRVESEFLELSAMLRAAEESRNYYRHRSENATENELMGAALNAVIKAIKK